MFGTKRIFLVLAVILGVVYGAFPAMAQEGKLECFEINAQYRGSVKKGFEELGCALGYFMTMPDGQQQVILHACVKHPEKKKSFYAFRVNLVFSTKGGAVSTVSEVYSWFDGFEPEQQAQIKDMVELLGMVRDGSIGGFLTAPFKINQTELTVQAAGKAAGKNFEYNITRPGKNPLEGKFFIEKDKAGNLVLEKFRFKRGKIVISFVCVPPEKIQGKYQTLSPYDKIVFAK